MNVKLTKEHKITEAELWHDYYCALLSASSTPTILTAAENADKALEEYKKRWSDE